MELGELKPLLTTLVMPPAGPLIGIGLGLLLMRARRARQWRSQAGLTLASVSALSLWLLSCHAVAVWLASNILPQVAPIEPARLAHLKAQGGQAVVVLGGGLVPQAPEYQQPQPASATAERLRYGLKMARESGLPLGFAGGVGWAAAGQAHHPSEAEVAQTLAQEAGQTIGWLDDQSRDTAENARQMRALMQAERIERIVLVTHAWHMPRSLAHFEQAGFEVIAAPMGFVTPRTRPLLECLPSPRGLMNSQQVLRESLALRLL
ncbi:MAG: YdcF family protein [Betaproteobacteria bacterium]|nr:YdcF family protein [Betaproteobacteria bacterium]